MHNTTTEMRECVGCKTPMSLDNFEKHKKGVRFKTCMHCRKNDQDMTKIIRKMYREDNRERIREREKAYRDSHADEIKERRKVYNGANKEQLTDRQKAYNEANKEKIK